MATWGRSIQPRGARIILEKCTGKLIGPVSARKQGIVILPKGKTASGAEQRESSQASQEVVSPSAPDPIKAVSATPPGVAPGAMTLHQAALGGHQQKVTDLLNAGADVNMSDIVGRTPLHMAALGGHRQLTEFLLSKGADPQARDKDGRTPQALAVSRGHQELAEFLQGQGK